MMPAGMAAAAEAGARAELSTCTRHRGFIGGQQTHVMRVRAHKLVVV